MLWGKGGDICPRSQLGDSRAKTGLTGLLSPSHVAVSKPSSCVRALCPGILAWGLGIAVLAWGVWPVRGRQWGCGQPAPIFPDSCTTYPDRLKHAFFADRLKLCVPSLLTL